MIYKTVLNTEREKEREINEEKMLTILKIRYVQNRFKKPK